MGSLGRLNAIYLLPGGRSSRKRGIPSRQRLCYVSEAFRKLLVPTASDTFPEAALSRPFLTQSLLHSWFLNLCPSFDSYVSDSGCYWVFPG